MVDDVVQDPATVLSQELSALAQLGHRYYLHGMYVESARLFEFVLRHEPSHADHHRSLGKALHADGLHKEALQAYSRAIRLGLAEADVHFYMGQCWLYLNEVDMAGQSLESCLRLAAVHRQEAASLAQRARQLLLLVKRHQRKLTQGAQEISLSQDGPVNQSNI
jgi:tetratricopeptide (TPR) repeat protein